MNVVVKKPVPIYEVTCCECASVIQYRAAEVCCHHITCPVCGMTLWANIICPVKMDEVDNENPEP